MKTNRFSRHVAQPRPHLDTGLRRYDGRLRLWINPETAFKAEAYFQRSSRSTRNKKCKITLVIFVSSFEKQWWMGLRHTGEDRYPGGAALKNRGFPLSRE